MKRKSVIFIHGIGPQNEGYSDQLWNILWQNRNPEGIHKYELLYYDVFKKLNEKLEMNDFIKKYGITKILEKIIKTKDISANVEEKLTSALQDTVSHVLYFLAFRDAKNAILNRFKKKLLEVIEDALAEDVYPPDLEIIIVSHSLGTVVAYMGLHTIISEQGLGLQDDLKIKSFFTLASPLSLIKKVSDKLNIALPHITSGIKKPVEWNPVKEINVSNIDDWFSYRHQLDPVASLVPLVGDFLDNEDESPFLFDKIHIDNVHAFSNYTTQARDLIVDEIKEEV